MKLQRQLLSPSIQTEFYQRVTSLFLFFRQRRHAQRIQLKTSPPITFLKEQTKRVQLTQCTRIPSVLCGTLDMQGTMAMQRRQRRDLCGLKSRRSLPHELGERQTTM